MISNQARLFKDFSYIPMKVTFKDGGIWQFFPMRKTEVIELIKGQGRGHFHSPNCKPFAAMRFPSGAIYDFILAASRDKATRVRAWR